MVAPELAQRPDLGTAQGVRARGAPLEIHLVPAKRHQLRDPQAMAVGEEYHRRVALTVPAALAGHFDQVLDFGRREVAAVVHRFVSCWGARVALQAAFRLGHDLRLWTK
jgi:hypothetical protein